MKTLIAAFMFMTKVENHFLESVSFTFMLSLRWKLFYAPYLPIILTLTFILHSISYFHPLWSSLSPLIYTFCTIIKLVQGRGDNSNDKSDINGGEGNSNIDDSKSDTKKSGGNTNKCEGEGKCKGNNKGISLHFCLFIFI